jgi:hypothetical protein
VAWATGSKEGLALMRVGIVVIALGVFLVAAVGIFLRPVYNWDMVGYIGLIKEQSHSAPTEIHATTYETVRSTVPDKSFEELKYWNERRKIAYEDPVSFVETLSFYRIRVGYWGVGYLLSKAGIDEIVAYRLIGSFFYFAVCAAVLWHLVSTVPNRLTVPNWLAVLGLALLVAFYPPLLNLGRVMVPGTMVVFGVVLGFSLLIRQHLIAGALILLATVFVRTDLGIFCAFLAVPVLFVGAGPLSRRICASAILCLAIPTVLSLNSFFQHPGWSKLMTPAAQCPNRGCASQLVGLSLRSAR